MCKAMEELIKDGEARGEARGESNGAIKTLIGLVKDGLLSVKDAAPRAGMTESQFREKMKKGRYIRELRQHESFLRGYQYVQSYGRVN